MKNIFKEQILNKVYELQKKYDNVIPYFIKDKNNKDYALIFCNFEVKMYSLNPKEKMLNFAGYISKKTDINSGAFSEEILAHKEVELSIVESFYNGVGLEKKMMQFYEKCCDYLNINKIKIFSSNKRKSFYKRLGYFSFDNKNQNLLNKQVEEYFSDDELSDINCNKHIK